MASDRVEPAELRREAKGREGREGGRAEKRTALTEESVAARRDTYSRPLGGRQRDARLSGLVGGMVELQALANGSSVPCVFRLVRASEHSGQAVNWLSGGLYAR